MRFARDGAGMRRIAKKTIRETDAPASPEAVAASRPE
jgi:hypothetical protein